MHSGVITAKVKAFLALEALMMGYPGVYSPAIYVPYFFKQIERVREADEPWRLLDPVQLKTFVNLVLDYIGGERRISGDRRQETQTVEVEQRSSDRRWVSFQIEHLP